MERYMGRADEVDELAAQTLKSAQDLINRPPEAMPGEYENFAQYLNETKVDSLNLEYPYFNSVVWVYGEGIQPKFKKNKVGDRPFARGVVEGIHQGFDFKVVEKNGEQVVKGYHIIQTGRRQRQTKYGSIISRDDMFTFIEIDTAVVWSQSRFEELGPKCEPVMWPVHSLPPALAKLSELAVNISESEELGAGPFLTSEQQMAWSEKIRGCAETKFGILGRLVELETLVALGSHDQSLDLQLVTGFNDQNNAEDEALSPVSVVGTCLGVVSAPEGAGDDEIMKEAFPGLWLVIDPDRATKQKYCTEDGRTIFVPLSQEVESKFIT